jgi:nucleoside-diphosphate-sugar epimerase
VKRAVLITGATGFLGQYVTKFLCRERKCFLLVRRASFAKAQEMFKKLPNITLVEGDITEADIFSLDSDIEQLNKFELDIIHSAALYDLDASHADNYLYNIVGTQNMLAATRFLKQVRQFIHISTIAVAGDYVGTFTEDMLIEGQGFSNYYTKTKFDAEVIFHKFDSPFQKVVIRPGIIIGDSHTGDFAKIDGIYYVLALFNRVFQRSLVKHLLAKLPLLPLPYDKKALMPLVAVDDVARFICMVEKDPPKQHRVFQISDMTYGCRVEDFYRWALRKFNVEVKLTPVAKSGILQKSFPWPDIPASAIDYMYQSVVYDHQSVSKEYPDFKATSFWEMADTIFSGAKKRFKT